MKVVLSSLFAVALVVVLTMTSPASAGMSFKGAVAAGADSSITLIKEKKTCAQKEARCMKKAKGDAKKAKNCAKRMKKCAKKAKK